MYSLVYIPCASRTEAEKIANILLKEKRIACANIIENITSLYMWQGEMQNENECLLLAKTRSHLFPKIRTLVEKHHSYECPCTLSFDIQNGNAEYLKWLDNQLQ